MKEKNERIYESGFDSGYQAAMNQQLRGGENQTAFVVGLIAGLFGFWGLAHLINGKLGSGLLWLFIGGPLVSGILLAIILATAFIGAIVALPLHVYIVYKVSKSGARSN